MTSQAHPLLHGRGLDADGPVDGRPGQRVRDHVGDRPLEQGGVGLHEGHRLRHVDLAFGARRVAHCWPRPPRCPPARPESIQARRRRSAAGSCRAGSRPPGRDGRSAASMVPSSSSRSAADQSTSCCCKLVTAALMEASGVRRSWETACRRVRRSASVSREVLGEGHLLAQRPALQRQPELVREGPQHLLVDRAELPAGEHQATVTGTVQVDRHPGPGADGAFGPLAASVTHCVPERSRTATPWSPKLLRSCSTTGWRGSAAPIREPS